MNHAALLASTPIDDFLAGAGGSGAGQRWEAVGSGLGLAGTVLAVGVVVFLAVVHRGSRSEVKLLLSVAMTGGALMVAGGVVEAIGTAQVLDAGWTDVLSDGSASSALLRLLGGVLLLLGLGDETVAVAPGVGDVVGASDGRQVDRGAVPAAGGSETQRWVPGAASSFGVVGLGLGVLSFSFDGHTTSEGPQLLHALVNVVHVGAVGVWFGGVVALALLAVARRRSESVGPLLVSYSRLATAALAAVFVAGAGLVVMILGSAGDLTGTAWGRQLLVKLAAVAAATAIGAYHHVLVRRLAGGAPLEEQVARRSLLLEASMLALAVVATTFLTRASIV